MREHRLMLIKRTDIGNFEIINLVLYGIIIAMKSKLAKQQISLIKLYRELEELDRNAVVPSENATYESYREAVIRFSGVDNLINKILEQGIRLSKEQHLKLKTQQPINFNKIAFCYSKMNYKLASLYYYLQALALQKALYSSAEKRILNSEMAKTLDGLYQLVLPFPLLSELTEQLTYVYKLFLQDQN